MQIQKLRDELQKIKDELREEIAKSRVVEQRHEQELATLKKDHEELEGNLWTFILSPWRIGPPAAAEDQTGFLK